MLRRYVPFLLGFGLMLLSLPLWAQTNFSVTSPHGGAVYTGESVSAVLAPLPADAVAQCNASFPSIPVTGAIKTGPNYGGIYQGEHRWSGTVGCVRDDNGGDLFLNGYTVYADVDSCDDGSDPLPDGTCPVVENCPFVVGEVFIKSGAGARPAGFCDQGCSFTQDGPSNQYQDGWIGAYSVSGSCSPSDADPPDTGLNCIETTAGNQHCLDPTAQENCGTINGEYLCLGAAPQGGCIFTPNGQAICEGGSQTNSPSETITDQDGNDYDVFPNGNTGGDLGGNGSTTGTNDTDGDGIPGGTGTGEEQGECDGSNCIGVLPGANETVDTFGDQFSSFYSRIENSPLLSAYDNFIGQVPAGTCTGVDSDPLAFLDNAVLTIDAHCTLWDDVAPIISALMLAAWSLTAGIIVLRA